MYLLCHLVLQDHLWLYRTKLFIVHNYPAKFGSDSHCGSGDITHLIYHVTFQDHVIKESSKFNGLCKGLIECNNPARFGGHGHFLSGANVFNL